MSRWKDIAFEAIADLSEDTQTLLPLQEGAEGPFTANLDTLEAGGGVLNQKTIRAYFWKFRRELEGCNAMMARQDHDRWFIVSGVAKEDDHG